MAASSRFDELREQLSGTIVEPSDANYEETRALFNAMIETRPAAIAQVAGPDDIAAAIRFARENDIKLAVRSGGHSVAGHSLVQDGLVIDVRPLKSIDVDPVARTARVGSGVNWGEFDKATAAHDMVTTGGRVTTTGVAGYTLGGGNGWLDRTFGLAVDNLLSVDLVTADGRQVTANADENPELFWALRGGGGNFGVATSFTFRLYPSESVYAGIFLWDSSRGEEVTLAYRDLMDSAPRELGGGMLWLNAPPEDFVPAHLQNKLAVGIAFCYVGDESAGEKFAAPLRALSPDLDAVEQVQYAEFNSSLDDPPGNRNWWTADYLNELPDEAVKIFVEHSKELPGGTSIQSAMFPWGGAVTDVADDDTPLTGRDAKWHSHPFGVWEKAEDDDRAIGWCKGMRDKLKPFTTGAVYLNFVGDEGQDRVVAAFGETKYKRLAQIKAEWDPDNVFRGNQNIKPAK